MPDLFDAPRHPYTNALLAAIPEHNKGARRLSALRVEVTSKGRDVGVAAAYARTLTWYAAKSGNAAAKTAAPDDPETLTADAVGRYDKDRPAAAFSRLGPLARRFPHAQTVRFHLGLLLIYFGDVAKARQELALARAEGPATRLGKRAQALLKAGQNS